MKNNSNTFGKKEFAELYWFNNDWLNNFIKNKANIERLKTLNDLGGIPYDILTKLIPYDIGFLTNSKLTKEQYQYELERLDIESLSYLSNLFHKIDNSVHFELIQLIQKKCSDNVYTQAIKNFADIHKTIPTSMAEHYKNLTKNLLWNGNDFEVSEDYIRKLSNEIVAKYSLNTIVSILVNKNCPKDVFDQHSNLELYSQIFFLKHVLASPHCSEEKAKQILNKNSEEILLKWAMKNPNYSKNFIYDICKISDNSVYTYYLSHPSYTKQDIIKDLEDWESLSINTVKGLAENPNFDLDCLHLLMNQPLLSMYIEPALKSISLNILDKKTISDIFDFLCKHKMPLGTSSFGILTPFLNDGAFVKECYLKIKDNPSGLGESIADLIYMYQRNEISIPKEICILAGSSSRKHLLQLLIKEKECPTEILWKIPMDNSVNKHNIQNHPNYRTLANGILEAIQL